MNFSAVILAGGKSSRMGRDKAWIHFEGLPLLARQVALARSLHPSKVLISAPTDRDYSVFGCPVLPDKSADAGPLAGIAAALCEAHTSHLLVLAVDMPHLTVSALRALLENCNDAAGVVPKVKHRIEPLAAVYPGTSLFVAEDLLQRQLRSVRNFAEYCKQAGLISYREMEARYHICFSNWNTPSDLPAPLPLLPHAARRKRRRVQVKPSSGT